ncbi:MAG: nitroreductase [Candidatus Dormibacteraeota bacterium]|nr:nitroreductase [Candidatus Dormibacteraeota bacterium]
MDVIEAIRTRRTHKLYEPVPLTRQEIDGLLEVARWAPNHHLTNPWRFRVLGPESLARLKAAADARKPGSSRKLERAPTRIVVTAIQGADERQAEEDRLATGAAIYAVLLAAHARGLAGFWSTPEVIHAAEGRAALGLPADERAVGLLHLGHASHEVPPRERTSLADVVTYLD